MSEIASVYLMGFVSGGLAVGLLIWALIDFRAEPFDDPTEHGSRPL